MKQSTRSQHLKIGRRLNRRTCRDRNIPLRRARECRRSASASVSALVEDAKRETIPVAWYICVVQGAHHSTLSLMAMPLDQPWSWVSAKQECLGGRYGRRPASKNHVIQLEPTLNASRDSSWFLNGPFETLSCLSLVPHQLWVLKQALEAVLAFAASFWSAAKRLGEIFGARHF